MRNRLVVALLALALAFLAGACQKIEEPPQLEAKLNWITAPATDSIPLEYGELVSVTPIPEFPYQAMLWFKRADQSVVAVRVNTAHGAMAPSVLEIPRR